MRINSKAAFLWDESFLWGLMAYEALKDNGLPFDLLRSDDIRNGVLKNYKMLFVPGGWASNKLKGLGDEGAKEIKSFVAGGGNYLGFCGGAGLATLDGIGLLDIKRRPTKDRVPSFSGRINLNVNEHQIWGNKLDEDLPFNSKQGHIFHAWWPSQFLTPPIPPLGKGSIKILAAYGHALPDAFSSDLCVGDVLRSKGNWIELESFYNINLDPERLNGEPAVIEGRYGKGKVILSLIHFDTPDDKSGHAVLRRLWEYFIDDGATYPAPVETASPAPRFTKRNPEAISGLLDTVSDLIELGKRNFLWFHRNPMLFQWRRGVRGLEYCTLYVLIEKIAVLLSFHSNSSRFASSDFNAQLTKIAEILKPFCQKAKELLILERLALQNGHITYEKCDDAKIQELRTELFSNSKSYGGLFKRLINRVDKLLYDLIK